MDPEEFPLPGVLENKTQKGMKSVIFWVNVRFIWEYLNGSGSFGWCEFSHSETFILKFYFGRIKRPIIVIVFMIAGFMFTICCFVFRLTSLKMCLVISLAKCYAN